MIVGGVLGSPISHSLSPLLHKTAYQLMGVQASYSAFEVKGGELELFLASEGSVLNAISLTMPLKEEALQIADEVSALSLQISSGNTLFNRSGKWRLTSTDVEGFTYALEQHNQNAQGDVLVIGAGATARAVLAACNGVSRSISVVNRSVSREDSIKSCAPDESIRFIQWDSEIDFSAYDLVINTTPLDAASIFVDQLVRTDATYFEVLYKPWPTPLLSGWREQGGFGIDGLDLLIHQAISQIQIFSGQAVDRLSMAKELRSVGIKALS